MTPRPGIDFASLFAAAPTPFLLLNRDLTIADANPAYLRTTSRIRGQIVGRYVFDAFPDNPADLTATGVANLHASLRRVLEHGGTDTMAIQRYDVANADGVFEERYFSPVNVAIGDGTGAVAWILHRVEDVTQIVLDVEVAATRSDLERPSLDAVADLLARSAELGERVRELADALSRERTVALALQAALVPDLPRPAGLTLAARYRPASAGVHVGGDWYDAVALPDGHVTIVIGDVVGHDVTSAAKMGQASTMLRALAHDRRDEPPAHVLGRLEGICADAGIDVLATAVLARIEPASLTGGPRVVRWANAGHPPPLLLVPGGHVHVLDTDTDTDVMLGVEVGARRHDHSTQLPAGGTLLLYTDGLIESHDSDLGHGLDSLTKVAERYADAPVEELVDAVTSECAPAGDDIAILAVRADTAE